MNPSFHQYNQTFFIHPFIDLSIYPLIHIFVYPSKTSMCVSVCLSACLCLLFSYEYLSISLFLSLLSIWVYMTYSAEGSSYLYASLTRQEIRQILYVYKSFGFQTIYLSYLCIFWRTQFTLNIHSLRFLKLIFRIILYSHCFLVNDLAI